MLEEKNRYENNLHRHFMVRVLAPPFIALLVLSIILLWQLGGILHRQAISDLRRSATTSAIALTREFSLRETSLKQTGDELFRLKREYVSNRQKLDSNRQACRDYILQHAEFQDAPRNICRPFLSALALTGPSLVGLENEYVRQSEILIRDQNQRINERLAAYKQFFPETIALYVTNGDKQTVSSALSGAFKGSPNLFTEDAQLALSIPVLGKLLPTEDFNLAVFAFPIKGGSVLAAYDLRNTNFVRQVWLSTPIDRSQAIAVVLDSTGQLAYPSLEDSARFKQSMGDLQQKQFIELELDGVDHTVVAARVRDSNWFVAVASPTAAVLAPLRDAQLAGIAIIGIFMVGFVWVGTFFVQRTLRNIISLVSGAMVFGSGRLDYKITLEHADGEFLRLADTMNAMAARIAAAERAIDEKNKEFISIATHELRAPLTSIIGHLSLFKEIHEAKLNDKSKYLLNQAYYDSARLRDLVNDMLNVARLESGRSELSLTDVAIKPIANEIMKTMDVVAKLAKVTLTYKSTNAAAVVADEQRLKIIINNFVSNAIKYNRPNGHVKVSHLQKDKQLVTLIEDDGLGIPEEQKAHLFEKFFRVKHDDRKTVTGTGLGMYITKQYIDDMHGQIWFESEHGKGTKFYFSLPLAKVRLRTRIKKLVQRKLRRRPSKKT